MRWQVGAHQHALAGSGPYATLRRGTTGLLHGGAKDESSPPKTESGHALGGGVGGVYQESARIFTRGEAK